jgi:hypothetical protein
MWWMLLGQLTQAQSLSAQPKPTIEQYADCLSECVMKELVDVPPLLIFVPEKNIGFKRELDLRLQSLLLSKSVRVRETPFENAQELRYDVQSANVSVEEADGQILRKVALSIFIKVLASGDLQRTKLVTAEQVDTLSQTDLERLNDPRYPETTIQLRRTWFENAVVPTLTTLSLGIIVYLFFSVRSN